MVTTEKAVIARYEHKGERFELLVDPDLAMDLKHGKEVSFNDLLAIDTVFKDVKKGEEKSPEAIKAAFGTTDVRDVARKIITQGDVQLTTDQRRRIAESKRKEIIAFIAGNAINPQTKAPHPPQRIETAMDEAKVSVDASRPASEQAAEIVKKLKALLPISMEKLRVAVKIPATFAGKASAIVHKYSIEKEEWQSDGSLVAVLELPAAVKQELFNELNQLTHGDVETKILE